MLNRSKILLSAWADYRVRRLGVWAAGDENGRSFIRAIFAKALTAAWAKAKRAAAAVALTETAVAFVAAERRVHAAAVAAMDPMSRSARINTIRDELQVLDYAPWGVRTSQRRMNLSTELQLLTA